MTGSGNQLVHHRCAQATHRRALNTLDRVPNSSHVVLRPINSVREANECVMVGNDHLANPTCGSEGSKCLVATWDALGSSTFELSVSTGCSFI